MLASVGRIECWQVLGELNEREISIEDVREAVNEMNLGKAPGWKAGLEWLVRLLNASLRGAS